MGKIMSIEKTLVYVLEMDGIKAVHLDIDSVCDALKMEYEDRVDEDILSMKFNLSAKHMSDKELKDLPEFEGW